MLGSRRSKVLYALVDEYVQSAAPVSSAQIAHAYMMGVSPATIRHELYALENAGLAYAPHTSAGRIPTNLGYQLFVNKVLLGFATSDLKGAQAVIPEIQEALQDADYTSQPIGSTIEALARYTGLLSLFWWASAHPRIKYTGVSGLLRQPEFSHSEDLAPLLELLEVPAESARLPEMAFQSSNFIIHVGLGAEPPYTSYALIARQMNLRQPAIVGLVGPTRLDYQKAINALDAAAAQIERALAQR